MNVFGRFQLCRIAHDAAARSARNAVTAFKHGAGVQARQLRSQALQLGLRGKSNLSHHSVFFPENYEDEFEAIFTRKEPVPDPAIYICNAPGMTSNPENESWFVLINAPRPNFSRRAHQLAKAPPIEQQDAAHPP